MTTQKKTLMTLITHKTNNSQQPEDLSAREGSCLASGTQTTSSEPSADTSQNTQEVQDK